MIIGKIKGLIEAVEQDIKHGEAYAGHLHDCYLKFMKAVVDILGPLEHKAEEVTKSHEVKITPETSTTLDILK